MSYRTLSEKLQMWRAERPDEWTMDEFIRDAKALESQLQASGWVSVDEPPKEVFDCLLRFDDKAGYRLTIGAYCVPLEKWIIKDEDLSIEDLTMWQRITPPTE